MKNQKYKRCCGSGHTHVLSKAAPMVGVEHDSTQKPAAGISQMLQRALAYQQGGQLRQAEMLYEKVLSMQPRNVDALLWRGVIASQAGRLDEAEALIKKAIRVKPASPDAFNTLGGILKAQGQHQEAAICYRRALGLKPDFANAHYNLGCILQLQGRLREAVACYQRALDLEPSLAIAHCNLGNLLRAQGHLEDAAECYRRALRIKPDFPEVYFNLAAVLFEQGYPGALDEVVACFRQALLLKPNLHVVHSGLLFALNNLAWLGAEELLAEHQEFYRQHALPLTVNMQGWPNDKDPHRKLRVGYVSPDFCNHSCAFFIEPLLERHNHVHVEVYCYAEVDKSDVVTDRLKGLVEHWRSTVGISDAAVVEMIRQDQIDILVDLAGHTDKNRLQVFAHKPAPIQVSWLGYPNTTGLKTIDYRFTDVIADPLGRADEMHTEKLLRLPHGFLCYRPPQDSPPVFGLPAERAGHVTFGSFNAISKVTSSVIDVWARILAALPDSRLLIKGRSFADPGSRERFVSLFEKQGLQTERVDLLSWIPSRSGHLEKYNQVDIALDTFPYNGTTTTCEALWMGVPVLTLRGDRHAARVGASLLSRIGLNNELIAQDQSDYVEKAVALAGNRLRLTHLRNSLRKLMQDSPLCNAADFAGQVEKLYREIWQEWCSRCETR